MPKPILEFPPNDLRGCDAERILLNPVTGNVAAVGRCGEIPARGTTRCHEHPKTRDLPRHPPPQLGKPPPYILDPLSGKVHLAAEPRTVRHGR